MLLFISLQLGGAYREMRREVSTASRESDLALLLVARAGFKSESQQPLRRRKLERKLGREGDTSERELGDGEQPKRG